MPAVVNIVDNSFCAFMANTMETFMEYLNSIPQKFYRKAPQWSDIIWTVNGFKKIRINDSMFLIL